MITAKNLRKAGFVTQEKQPLDDDGWYIEWVLHVRPGIGIYVTQDSDGKFAPEIEIWGVFIHLKITTVTELITLAKLLK